MKVDEVMKKIIKFILVIVIVCVLGYVGYRFYEKNKPIDYTGKWHIEITKDYINIREFPEQYSRNMGKAKKGEKYLVEEVNLDDDSYVWYKTSKGWISNSRSEHDWIKDINNDKDIYNPVLKYKEDTYHVKNIQSINYDNLECWDDSDYEVKHEVFIDYNDMERGTQYWIKYTITDSVGNSTSKLQRIEFEERPTIPLSDISQARK